MEELPCDWSSSRVEQSTLKWVNSQKNAFTRWTNRHLVENLFSPIQDAYTAFEDGRKLMELVNALYDIPLPTKYRKNPEKRIWKLDNLLLAQEMMDKAGVKTHFLKIEHLCDHDEKMILGMLWAFIHDYSLSRAIQGNTGGSAKQQLLNWCNEQIDGFHAPIRNFSSDFADGSVFCAIYSSRRPDLFHGVSMMDPDQAESNLTHAFQVGEDIFKIPQLLDVHEILGNPKPDDRAVLMYIGEIFHVFSSQPPREVCAAQVKEFVHVDRMLQESAQQFESRMHALLDWIRLTTDKFRSGEFVSGAKSFSEKQEIMRSYFVNDVPSHMFEDFSLRRVFADIQNAFQLSGKAAYMIPPHVTFDKLDHAWTSLHEAESLFKNTGIMIETFETIAAEHLKSLMKSTDELRELVAASRLKSFDNRWRTREEAVRDHQYVELKYKHTAAPVQKLTDLLTEIRRQQTIDGRSLYTPADPISLNRIRAASIEQDSLIAEYLSDIDSFLNSIGVETLISQYHDKSMVFLEWCKDSRTSLKFFEVACKNNDQSSVLKDIYTLLHETQKKEPDRKVLHNLAVDIDTELMLGNLDLLAGISCNRSTVFVPEPSCCPEQLDILFLQIKEDLSTLRQRIEASDMEGIIKHLKLGYETIVFEVQEFISVSNQTVAKCSPKEANYKEVSCALEKLAVVLSRIVELYNDIDRLDDICDQLTILKEKNAQKHDKMEYTNLDMKISETLRDSLTSLRSDTMHVNDHLIASQRNLRMYGLIDDFKSSSNELVLWSLKSVNQLGLCENPSRMDIENATASLSTFKEEYMSVKREERNRLIDILGILQKEYSDSEVVATLSMSEVDNAFSSSDDSASLLSKKLLAIGSSYKLDGTRTKYVSMCTKFLAELENSRASLSSLKQEACQLDIDTSLAVLDQFMSETLEQFHNQFENLASLYSELMDQNLEIECDLSNIERDPHLSIITIEKQLFLLEAQAIDLGHQIKDMSCFNRVSLQISQFEKSVEGLLFEVSKQEDLLVLSNDPSNEDLDRTETQLYRYYGHVEVQLTQSRTAIEEAHFEMWREISKLELLRQENVNLEYEHAAIPTVKPHLNLLAISSAFKSLALTASSLKANIGKCRLMKETTALQVEYESSVDGIVTWMNSCVNVSVDTANGLNAEMEKLTILRQSFKKQSSQLESLTVQYKCLLKNKRALHETLVVGMTPRELSRQMYTLGDVISYNEREINTLKRVQDSRLRLQTYVDLITSLDSWISKITHRLEQLKGNHREICEYLEELKGERVLLSDQRDAAMDMYAHFCKVSFDIKDKVTIDNEELLPASFQERFNNFNKLASSLIMEAKGYLLQKRQTSYLQAYTPRAAALKQWILASRDRLAALFESASVSKDADLDTIANAADECESYLQCDRGYMEIELDELRNIALEFRRSCSAESDRTTLSPEPTELNALLREIDSEANRLSALVGGTSHDSRLRIMIKEFEKDAAALVSFVDASTKSIISGQLSGNAHDSVSLIQEDFDVRSRVLTKCVRAYMDICRHQAGIPEDKRYVPDSTMSLESLSLSLKNLELLVSSTAAKISNESRFSESSYLKNKISTQVTSLASWIDEQLKSLSLSTSKSYGQESEIHSVESEMEKYFNESKGVKMAALFDLRVCYAELEKCLSLSDQDPATDIREIISSTYDSFDCLTEYEYEISNALSTAKHTLTQTARMEEDDHDKQTQLLEEYFILADKKKRGRLGDSMLLDAYSCAGLSIKRSKAYGVLTRMGITSNEITLEQFKASVPEIRRDLEFDKIILALFVLSEQNDYIKAEQLHVDPLSDADIDYLSERLTQSPDGKLDYRAFIDSRRSYSVGMKDETASVTLPPTSKSRRLCLSSPQ